jgi:isoleucyl-tRNA synthetase
VADRSQVDPELERAMDAIRRLASLGRSAREAGNRRVRQPLGTIRVAVPPAVAANPRFAELLELLRQEVNVGAVELVSSDAELVRLRPKANFRTLGKRFGKRTPEVAAGISRIPAVELRRLEEGQSITVPLDDGLVRVEPEDVVIEREVATDWLVQSAGPFVVALDPRLTPELIADGLAREMVSRVQRLRKEAGYQYTTRIALAVAGDDTVMAAARQHADFVRGETLARSLELGRQLDPCDARDDASIDQYQVTLTVRRWSAEQSR